MAADTTLYIGNSVVGFFIFCMFCCLCIQCGRFCDWLAQPLRRQQRIDVMDLFHDIDAKTDPESVCSEHDGTIEIEGTV